MKIKNQNPIKKLNQKSKSKKHNKSRSKSNQKSSKAKFNPLDYLNALIQLTNNIKTIKVKRNNIGQKRDLSSALTLATPAMQKTISSQKIRSKSSLSQHRKKSVFSNVNNMKQVLNINLNNYIITQDDNQNCIKFTSQSSALPSVNVSPKKQKQNQDINKIKPICDHKSYKNKFNNQFIDYGHYAKKIQNAWRSYQTYKMVHRYYRHFKKQKKNQKEHQQQMRKLQYTSRNKKSPYEQVANCDQPLAAIVYMKDFYDVSSCKNEVNDQNVYQNTNDRHSQPNKNCQNQINSSFQFKQQNLQKTLKLKFKKSGSNILQQKNKLIRVSSINSQQSGLTDLDLTKKFNQIKQFIQNQTKRQQSCLNQQKQQNQFIQQIPTVQIIKSYRQHENEVRPFQHNNKKNKQLVHQNANIKSYDLNRTPIILKQRNGEKLKKQYSSQNQLNQLTNLKYSPIQYNNQQNQYLMNNIIQEEAQKYNQLLSLIKQCKVKQGKKLNQNQNSGKYILTQLLNKLQQNKLQLQKQIKEVVSTPQSKNGNSFKHHPQNRLQFESKQSLNRDIQIRINQNEKHKFNRQRFTYKHTNIGTKNIGKDRLRVSSRKENFNDQSSQKYSEANSLNIITFDSKQIYKSFDSNQLLGGPQQQGSKSLKERQQQNKICLTKQINVQKNKQQTSSQLQQHHISLIKRFQDILSRQEKKIKQLQTLQDWNHYGDNQRLFQSVNYQQQDQSNSYTVKSNKISKHWPIQQQQVQSQSSDSLLSCSFRLFENEQINKLFDKHLQIRQIRKQKSIQNLNLLLEEKAISKNQFQQRLQQIQSKHLSQNIKIQTNQKKYSKMLLKIKKQALEFQKQIISAKNHLNSKNQPDQNLGQTDKLSKLKSSLSSQKLTIRRSFSAQSMVLKSILRQPIFMQEIQYGQIQSKKQQYAKILIKQQTITKIQNNNEVIQQKNQSKQSVFFKQQNKSGILKPDEEQINSKQISRSEIINNFDKDLNAHSQNQQGSQNQEYNQIKKEGKKQQIVIQQENRIVRCHQTIQSQGQIQQYIIQPLSLILKEQSQQSSNTFLNNSETFPHTQKSDQYNKQQQNSSNISQQHSQNISQCEQQQSSNVQLNFDLQQQQPCANSKEVESYENLSPRSIVKCSQELQKIIQTELLNELLEEIYMKDTLLLPFKPLIQEIFEFRQIQNQDIVKFLEQKLPNFYLQSLQKNQQINNFQNCQNEGDKIQNPFECLTFKQDLINKANQKINPTSKQILRLIRDFDFQINQYELILSQEIFKLARKSIQQEYSSKINQRRQKLLKSNTDIKNPDVIQKLYQRQKIKRAKIQKYLQYERDLRIMYMKAVFNCLNQLLIQQKSIATHMNCRSTIGTGQLTLSIKQFNLQRTSQQILRQFFHNSHNKIKQILKNKCILPSFKNYKDVQIFQKLMLKMIKDQIDQTQYKWLNYMDEVLQIWNIIANNIVQDVWKQAGNQINQAFLFKNQTLTTLQ